MTALQFILGIQYFAIIVLLFEFFYALMQKPSMTQKYVIILTIATILMFVGYNIEMTSVSLEECMAGTAVSYIGKPFIMFASLMLICSYNGFKVPRAAEVILLVYSLVFPVIVFTNDYHHLYYASTAFDASQPYSPLILTRGPLYYSYMISTVMYFILCIAIIIIGYKRSVHKNRKELAAYSALMVISGIGGYMVFLLNITDGYDFTMIGVFVGVIFLFLIFIRCNIFDVVSVAKELAVDSSPTGLIVYDAGNNIVYKNQMIMNTFDELLLKKKISGLSGKNNNISYNGRTFDVDVKELRVKNDYLGKSIEITDITFYSNYHKTLEHDVRERTEQIENIQREIIASVANIIEARSSETGEHIKRTSFFTKLIAKKLQNMGLYTNILTDSYIKLLYNVAPLHDIGKIAIPDAILNKPGKLTKEEFDIMKTHVDSGAEIVLSTLKGLETEEYVKAAYDIVKYHHERWDGTGYTYGLTGDEIPLSARIIALADSYDAITSKRCYKDAYNKDEALEIVRSECGTHFDPDVVDAFLLAIDDPDFIEEIRIL